MPRGKSAAPPYTDADAERDLAAIGDESEDMRVLERRMAEIADGRRERIERLREHKVPVARIAERMGVSTAAVHATMRRGK